MTCGSSSLKIISSSTTPGIFMDLPLETTLSNRFKILILGMHLGDSWWSAALYDSCHFLSGDAIIVQAVSVRMDTHGCAWYLCVCVSAGYYRALPCTQPLWESVIVLTVSCRVPLWPQVLWNSLPVTPRVWDPRIPWQFRQCLGQVRQFGFVTMCKLSMRTIEPPFPAPDPCSSRFAKTLHANREGCCTYINYWLDVMNYQLNIILLYFPANHWQL